jgi:hypothetical protein
MQYPEILSIIDAKLEQLQQAPSADSSIVLATAQLEASAELPLQPRRPGPRKLRRAASVAPGIAKTEEVDSPEPTAELAPSAALASATPAMKALPSSEVKTQVTILAAQRQSSPRHRKQIRSQPSALQSLAPATPVAVSAEEAQRQREQKQLAQKTREAAKQGRQEPELSAEYLAQQWFRKGQNISQRS